MARYVISQFTMPDGNVMELKDKVARQAVQGGTYFKGVTETEITDGSTATTVIIDGQEVPVKNGDIVVIGEKEFIYSVTDHKWHEFGDVTNLGALALKDSAVGVYTPGGSVSAPTFTGNSISYTPSGNVSKPNIVITPVSVPLQDIVSGGSVTEGIAASATLPELAFQYDAASQHLTLGWTGGEFTPNVPTSIDLPEAEQVNVLTGISAELDTAPVFAGTQATLGVAGTVSAPTFTGTRATIIVE